MIVRPVGHRVLVKPEKIEEKIGSIVIAKATTDKEQLAQVRGTVLDVGKDCWREFNDPWCKIGDTVLYQRYAGMRVPDGRGSFIEDMLLLNDLDITAIVEG